MENCACDQINRKCQEDRGHRARIRLKMTPKDKDSLFCYAILLSRLVSKLSTEVFAPNIEFKDIF